jgi:Gram-negative porin
MSFKSVASVLAVVAPALLAVSAAQAQAAPPSPADQTTTDQPASNDQPAKDVPPPPSHAELSPDTAHPPEPIPVPNAPEPAAKSWFTRPPIIVSFGDAAAPWKLQIYGFAEADFMHDSTQSFGDGMNSNLVARPGTLASQNGRTQFTVRNSRLGFEIKAPPTDGIKASGKLEMDFFGYDPSPSNSGGVSESGFYQNPTFRIRHAYLKLESDYVDLLAGQMYHLFGWQNSFLICSAAFLGIPNEVFGRTPQFRLSHTFKTDDVNFEMAVGAVRPVQRDSEYPDGEAGMRLMFNKWKGINTPGSGGTGANPAAIGVSGLVRQYKVVELSHTPAAYNKTHGWAVAAQALLPVIPVKNSDDRANALTLIGEFTVGSGYADQFTGMTGGASFPAALPIPAGSPMGTVGQTFSANIDNGLVAYDPSGALKTINWRTFVVGAQYYLPPGRTILAVNYTQGNSSNMATVLPPPGGAIKKSQYADANIFYDTTPSSRLGISYQYSRQQFVDNNYGHNHRAEALALYFF